MDRYHFALGRMPIDADGYRNQALIILDNETGSRIAHLPYDEAAEILLAALKLAHSAR